MLFRGGLCCGSRFFMASLTEIGTGSMGGLIASGPMMLLGLKALGLMILLMEFDLIGSRMLFVLFWRYLSPAPLSILLFPRSLIWSCETSALSSLLLSHLLLCSSKSFSMMFLWQIRQGFVRAPQASACLGYSTCAQVF